MSWAEDQIAHLIGMSMVSRKELENSTVDEVDDGEGHRRFRVWQADVRRLIEFVREYPEALDRDFPVGCTNIDPFGNDLDAEEEAT